MEEKEIKKWRKKVPVWTQIEDLFIIGGNYPLKPWVCSKNKDNKETLKEIFIAHNIDYPENCSFEQLVALFKKNFREVKI